MRIAVTGGTGFIGRHLSRALVDAGHTVVVIARGEDRRDTAIRSLPGVTFVSAATDDESRLASAFALCEAVAHCAGINRERGEQTYERVHVRATAAVIQARAFRTPLVSQAQVRMPAEGITEPLPPCDVLPDDLAPRLRLTPALIRAGVDRD